MRCLDIDTRASWEGPYRGMLADLGATSALEDVLTAAHLINRPEERFSTLAFSALHEAQNANERFRDLLTDFLRRQYTHINLYHSCRIVDRNTYDERGLLPSDVASLDRLAHVLFGDFPKLDEAISELKKTGYASHNQGGIGLWFARSGAIHFGDHYTAYGSEYLKGIAGRLGAEALARLENRGRPAVIRCTLAVANLADSDVRFAAFLPVEELVTSHDPEAPACMRAIGGATMHKSAIPPSAIAIEFLDEA